MTNEQIAELRLRNHRLASGALPTAGDAVRWLGAVQAQEHTIARWSMGERAHGIDDRAVTDALARGTILRTHLLRPTWHFVHAADLRWMQALTAPRVHVQNGSRYRALELDDALFARSHALLASLLAGGSHLTRAEIRRAFDREGIDTGDQRLAYLLMRAELDALICSGAPRGKQHTYALVDERIPPTAPLERDEALGTLALRFFASHGPATIQDFRWWSSLTVADIRRAIGMLGRRLERREVDGRTYWFTPEPHPTGPAAAPAAAPAAHFLQAYDEFLVAYSETKDVFDGVGPGGPSGGRRVTFLHALIVDGRVVGGWRRQLTARHARLEVKLRRGLRLEERDAVQHAAQRHGRFLDLPVDWAEV